MKQFKLGKDALILAILTLITVLTWIGFEVYWALTRSEVPEVLQRQLEPLNPYLEIQVIDKIKSQKSFNQKRGEEIYPPQKETLPEATASGNL